MTAIGSSFNASPATTGSTSYTFSRVGDASFTSSVEEGDIDVDRVVTLRPASTTTLVRRFGAVEKFNPSILDVSGSITKGRISISLNVDAILGSEMSTSDITAEIHNFFGALLDGDVVSNLVNGSTV